MAERDAPREGRRPSSLAESRCSRCLDGAQEAGTRLCEHEDGFLRVGGGHIPTGTGRNAPRMTLSELTMQAPTCR